MHLSKLSFAFFLLSAPLAGQLITTFAGTEWLFPATKIQALNAPIATLNAVAVDPKGVIYVSDPANQMVLRIAIDGTLTVAAGNGVTGFSGDGGPGSSASLGFAGALTTDAAGNLYLGDSGNNRVRKVDTSGIINTVAGNGGVGFAGDGGPAISATFNIPGGFAVDSSGNLYISDINNNRIRRVTPGGTITTIAGTGKAGFSGDGGPAISADLNAPSLLACDAANNLYVVDNKNNRIRKITPGGTITTIAGNGTAAFSGDGGQATQAGLWNPFGIAVDAGGNIYYTDISASRVRKISTSGIITTIAGTGVQGYTGDGGPAISAQLDAPVGVGVDPAGNVIVVGFNHVRKIDTAGVITTIAGNGNYRFSGDNGPALNSTFWTPAGMAFDPAGNLYFAESFSSRVRKISPQGIITSAAGTGVVGFSDADGFAVHANLQNPSSVATDKSGNLYICDQGNCRIRKVTPDGRITTVAGNGTCGFGGDTQAAIKALISPGGVNVDGNGNIYIADVGNNVIRKVTTDGIINTIVGTGRAGFSGDHGSATQATLRAPTDVLVDSANNIYIADAGNNAIRKVSGGVITTLAGTGAGGYGGDGGAATSAILNNPQKLAIDSAGNLYFGDTDNALVRRITPNGLIARVAGNGVHVFQGDGGPAASASLVTPVGVAVDPAGNVYISDSGANRIRKVLASSSSATVTPQSLTFSSANGSIPSVQTVSLDGSISGLSFSVSSSASWLNATPSSGSLPSGLQVSVDPANLVPNTYQGTLTITVPNATPATLSVAVSFTVEPATQPSLSAGPQAVSLSAIQGGPDQSGAINVTNTGGGALTFTATATTTSGGSWLKINGANGAAANGTATSAAPASVILSAAVGSLAPGVYQGSVAITGAGSTVNIPVSLTISEASAVIVLSQNGLTFTAVGGGGSPLPQTFGVLNTGTGAMSWAASATALSGGNWLSISPSSGVVQNPYLDVSNVTVGIDPTGLAPGDYYGRIQVTAPATNNPQSITVILTVLPAGSTPAPEIRPTGIIFTGAAGQNPGSQDVNIGTLKPTADSFISGSIGRGFSYLPASASVIPSQPQTVRVYPDFSNLQPGALERGTITLQFTDGTARTVSVLSVVAPAASSGLQPQAAGCASAALQILFSSLNANFVAHIGQALTIEAKISDACGNLIGPSASANIQAGFSNGDPNIKLVSTGNGVWSGSWKPIKSTSGAVSITVTAFVTSGLVLQNGQAALSGILTTGGSTPIVTAGGVVQAASFVGNTPVAPGTLITIYGANLANGTGQSPTLPLPQSQSGATVLLGNTPLPLLYTSTGQVNVQVPFDVPVNTPFQVSVQRDNLLSVPETLVIATAVPGIFSVNQQGTGQGVILKSDGITLAQPGSAAEAGDVIILYCTGLGPVSPAVPAGSPAPADPLSQTVNTVGLQIGGLPATVQYSGLAPGAAGLYQINAVVPQGVAPGPNVPVTVAVAGQTSPAVTMAIQ